MILRALVCVVCVLATAVLVAQGPVRAQETQRPFGSVVEEWNAAINQITTELTKRGLAPEREQPLTKRLAEISAEARKIKKQAQAEFDRFQGHLRALGRPPEEGAPPELEEIAAQRRQIEDEIAFYEARVKQADLAITRAKGLAGLIASRTLEHSLELLFKSFPLPFLPDTIAFAVPESFRKLAVLAHSPIDWWATLSSVERAERLPFRGALIILFAIAIGWGIRRALLRWFGRDPSIESPTYARRLTGAIAQGLGYGIVPALILGAFLYRVASGESIVSGLFAEVFTAFCGVMIMFTLAWALPRAVLAPELPAWRLYSVAPESARAISGRITFLAGVFAVDLFFQFADRYQFVSDELISLYALITITLESAGILALVHGRVWVADEGPPAAGPPSEDKTPAGTWGFWATTRRLAGLMAVSAVVTALAGYANLARYLAESVVISGMAAGILVLVRGLLRELIGGALRSRLLQVELRVLHETRSRLKFWLRAFLDLVIYAAGLLVILVIWGVSPLSILAWLGRVLTEVTIGNVTISIVDIAVALVVFIGAMALTRLIQRTLNEQVFPQTSLDPGVRHSLSAGLGYLGIVLAAALAFSALGIDLDNIALIAGALSVGIGFGLQNVVNNFVSGLILLVERPIKVGDWIIVGGNEGYVRRISVRATEIETFQRASVIVPNSEIIAGAVTNWTHKDRYGRVEVPVGVAYGSDVSRVMEILKGCLDAHQDILSWPKPYVLFRGFGESSLDFETRGYIANVEYRLNVVSDLGVAINQAFADAGIEIPFPQRDLHFRNLDQLDYVVGRKAGLTVKSEASPSATPPPQRVRAEPSEADD